MCVINQACQAVQTAWQENPQVVCVTALALLAQQAAQAAGEELGQTDLVEGLSPLFLAMAAKESQQRLQQKQR